MVCKDKEKQRENYRRWYARNQEKTKAKVLANKREVRSWFNALKESYQCTYCPENHPACMEFHHVTKDKLMAVSNMVQRAFSADSILEEIEKCVPICVNCHRKIHRRKRAVQDD